MFRTLFAVVLIAYTCALSYPLQSAPEKIYNSFADFPDADIGSGEHAYWGALKGGIDVQVSILRRADGSMYGYTGWWDKIWKMDINNTENDVLGMSEMTPYHTRDFFSYDKTYMNPYDTGIVRNNRVYRFLSGTFKASNGDLYGALHLEDQRACGSPSYGFVATPPTPLYCPHGGGVSGSLYRIGLAQCATDNVNYPCEDGGWMFLGTILAPKHDTLGFDGPFATGSNIAGAPMIERDGYLYIYYKEWVNPAVNPTLWQWVSVARAPLSAIQAQADSNKAGGPASPWKKFNGFGGACSSSNPHSALCWTQDPMSGVGGVIEKFKNLDPHADIVYSKTTGKYYMPLRYPVVPSLGENRNILRLYASDDAIQWERIATLDSVTSADSGVINYSSVIPIQQDLSSGDGSVVGSVFDVVYSRQDLRTSAVYGGITINPSDVYRVRVTLAPPNPAAPVDYDGDGISDLSIKGDDGYGRFYVDLSSNGFNGQDLQLETSYIGHGPGEVGASADFDGDGLTDFSVKSEYGHWRVNYAHDGFGINDWVDYYKDGSSESWGDTLCIPVPADYDGDGKADLSVYCKQDKRKWYIDYSANGFNGVDDSIYNYYSFKANTIPAPGDYNGDGKADLGVYYNYGQWTIDYSPTWGAWDFITEWAPDAYPVPADYNNDSLTDLASYAPFWWSGGGYWWAITPETYTSFFSRSGWGGAEFRPAPGDFDGDGLVDLAVKSDSTGIWYIDYAANGYGATDTTFSGWGDSTNHALYKRNDFEEDVKLVNTGERLGLSFELSDVSPLSVDVYTLQGRRITSLFQGKLGKGPNTISWSREELDRRGLKRGMYLLSLKAKGLRGTKRLMLTK